MLHLVGLSRLECETFGFFAGLALSGPRFTLAAFPVIKESPSDLTKHFHQPRGGTEGPGGGQPTSAAPNQTQRRIVAFGPCRALSRPSASRASASGLMAQNRLGWNPSASDSILRGPIWKIRAVSAKKLKSASPTVNSRAQKASGPEGAKLQVRGDEFNPWLERISCGLRENRNRRCQQATGDTQVMP